MRKDKLEFKIELDANGKKVSLDNMSIEATKALIVLANALTRMAELAGDAKISITKGSARVALAAPPKEIAEIEIEIPVIAANKSTKIEWIGPLREIQDLISKNGLTYSANVVKGRTQTPLINYFKQKRKFKPPTKKRQKPNFGIKFFEGKLLENGGKNPNIHILIGEQKVTVACTEEEAKRVNAFLYSKIMVAAWEQKKVGREPTYAFCDNYVNEILFNDYKTFIEKNLDQEGTAPLNAIHYKLRDILEAKKFGEARKFIRLFCNEGVDIGRLRAILIITKALKENDTLKEMLQKIAGILQVKTQRPIV